MLKLEGGGSVPPESNNGVVLCARLYTGKGVPLTRIPGKHCMLTTPTLGNKDACTSSNFGGDRSALSRVGRVK